MQLFLPSFAVTNLTMQSIVPALLMLTLVSCWFLSRTLSWVLAGITVVAGVWLQVFTVFALPPLVVMFSSAWYFSRQRQKGPQEWFAGVIFVVLAFLLATHHVPGFHNILVWDQPVKPNSPPLTFFLNVDKPLPALAVLMFFLVPGQGLLQSSRQWWQAAKLAWLPIVLAQLVIIGLAWLFGLIRLQPKLPEITGLFLLSNLLLTALVEGVMLRGFLQRQLMRQFGWSAFAVVIPAVIYGLIFYASGFTFMGFIVIANLFYGWIYLRSDSLEMSVLGQWLLNTVLFLFFTYPV